MDKFQQIESIVANELKKVGFDHNIDHVRRVYNLCIKIAKSEKGVDLVILRAAALLHDIGYFRDNQRGSDRHDEISTEMAEKILIKYQFYLDQIDKIKDCILSHRYRTDHKPDSIEAKILFDADKLDAVGAVGLLRGGIWLAKKGSNPFSTKNPKNYIQINHQGGKKKGKILDWHKHNFFVEYETKSKLLPQKLFTKTGRAIAKERVKFEKKYLDQLKAEIEGKR